LVTDSNPPPPAQDVSGLIIVGYWPGAFPGYQELLYTYDPVHQSLNRSDPSRNLIVIQSSQGEAVNDVFDPPDNEYWVVNNMELIGSGNGAQIALYGVQFPGWSACQRTNPATGLSYYQVRLHRALVESDEADDVALLSEFRNGMCCYSVGLLGYH